MALRRPFDAPAHVRALLVPGVPAYDPTKAESRPWPPDREALMLRLVREGLPITRIADRLGTHKTAIWRHLAGYGGIQAVRGDRCEYCGGLLPMLTSGMRAFPACTAPACQAKRAADVDAAKRAERRRTNPKCAHCGEPLGGDRATLTRPARYCAKPDCENEYQRNRRKTSFTYAWYFTLNSRWMQATGQLRGCPASPERPPGLTPPRARKGKLLLSLATWNYLLSAAERAAFMAGKRPQEVPHEERWHQSTATVERRRRLAREIVARRGTASAERVAREFGVSPTTVRRYWDPYFDPEALRASGYSAAARRAA